MDRSIVGNIVAIVAQGRRKERHQPESVHSQILQVIEFLGQTAKIADAVAVSVEERADVDLVDDCILVPERVLRQCQATCSLFTICYRSSPLPISLQIISLPIFGQTGLQTK